MKRRPQRGRGRKLGAHPGFGPVQAKIASEGYSKEEAGAILADSTRNASEGAKKRNPRLKRVKGRGR